MLKVGALRNEFTYGKLFHHLEEIVSELLRYFWKLPSVRTLTKFFLHSSDEVLDFFSLPGTIDVLIELCPMVPLVAKVPFVVSQPTLRYSDLITVTVAGAPPTVVPQAGVGGWGAII